MERIAGLLFTGFAIRAAGAVAAIALAVTVGGEVQDMFNAVTTTLEQLP